MVTAGGHVPALLQGKAGGPSTRAQPLAQRHPVCPQATGSELLPGGPSCPSACVGPAAGAEGTAGGGRRLHPGRGTHRRAAHAPGEKREGMGCRPGGSGRHGWSPGPCWGGAPPARSPLKVQGCIAWLAPGGQTPGLVNPAQAGTCPLPPAAGHPAACARHGAAFGPPASHSPGELGVSTGTAHGWEMAGPAGTASPAPHGAEPPGQGPGWSQANTPGLGVCGMGAHASPRELCLGRGEQPEPPPGHASQPWELCQRLPWAGVADQALQKATERSPHGGQGGEGRHCVSPW